MVSPAEEEDDREGAPEVPPVHKTPDSDSLLARYFREMARSGRLMTPREEAERARAMAEGYAAVWAQLLSHAPLAPRLIARALVVWPDNEALRGLAVLARQKRGKVALAQRARKAAPALHKLDRDRALLGELMALAEAHGTGHAAFLARVRRTHAAAERVRQEFARKNLRLVVAVARKYRRAAGMSLDDLIQEGNLGLLRAVDRFEVERGFRFSTYASWWIRHAVSRAVADRGRMVRHPVHLIEARYRLSRARERLEHTLGRPPSSRELSRATGLSERQVDTALEPGLEHGSSLDEPRYVGEERALHETLADPDAAERSGPVLLERQATLAQLTEAMGGLRPIEAEVLRQRFGFDDEEAERTLADIGREHGLSRERIRQIQGDALRKLRRALRRAAEREPV